MQQRTANEQSTSRGWRLFVAVPSAAAAATAAWWAWFFGLIAMTGCWAPSCEPRSNIPLSVIITAVSSTLANLALCLALWALTSLSINRLRRVGIWAAVVMLGCLLAFDATVFVLAS